MKKRLDIWYVYVEQWNLSNLDIIENDWVILQQKLCLDFRGIISYTVD
jgi:hypothetical protein